MIKKMTVKEILDDMWNNYPCQLPDRICRWSLFHGWSVGKYLMLRKGRKI